MILPWYYQLVAPPQAENRLREVGSEAAWTTSRRPKEQILTAPVGLTYSPVAHRRQDVAFELVQTITAAPFGHLRYGSFST
jgi:hypothetical protein